MIGTFIDLCFYLLNIMLELLALFVTITPLTNEKNDCVVNAYVHCQLYQTPTKYNKHIWRYARERRDKIRNDYTNTTEIINYPTFFEWMKTKGAITERKETTKYSTWVAGIRSYEPWLVVKPWKQSNQWHAVCIIGQTKDYYIAINDDPQYPYILIQKDVQILFYDYK